MLHGDRIVLNFPHSTLFSQEIPLKLLQEQTSSNLIPIKSVIWKYKFSPDTLNINPGNYITEIEIIEIYLDQKNISKNTIKLIDSSIPYHTIFILIYNNESQLHINYKKQNKNQYEIQKNFHTPWISPDKINLKIKGLNLDEVYENFFFQISKEIDTSKNQLSEAIEISIQKEKLESQIQTLQKKINTEKQFNRQTELLSKLRETRKKLKNLY